MKTPFLILLGIIIPIFSFARQLDELESYIEAIEKHETSTQHMAIIYAILQNTNEVCIHQQNGAKDNKIYVSKDGHQEVVFDKDEQLVHDGINDGSYNYFHPSQEPLKHFTADISPWIMFGQSPKDKTTVKSRIYAYMGDLEGGIRQAIKKNSFPEVRVSNEMQKQALAIFFYAIEEGDVEEVFQLFEVNNQLTDTQLINVLKKLNLGFEKIYKSN